MRRVEPAAVKSSIIRLAFAQAYEPRRRNIAAVAVTPGFLHSEAMIDLFGIEEGNKRDGAATDANFIASETFGKPLRPMDEGYYAYAKDSPIEPVMPDWP